MQILIQSIAYYSFINIKKTEEALFEEHMLFMNSLVIGILWLQFAIAFARQECRPDELPCENKECIKSESWCDEEFDCSDRSDEKHCNGDPCQDSYFQCENKLCIPESAVCNGYDNCGDDSDEVCEGMLGIEGQSSRRMEPNSTQSVMNAALYILSKRNYDYGWKKFTSRAVIALAFAGRVVEIPQEDMWLMKKRLNVQILDFMRFKSLDTPEDELNLVELALYINALYAVCENPRDFKGMDLVDFLYTETRMKLQPGFSLPAVLMTLCIAGNWDPLYTRYLISMYDDRNNDKTSFKAVTIMAMVACKSNGFEISERKRKFLQDLHFQSRRTDVYSEILSYQALHALNEKVEHHLWARQSADGAFIDLLATYYAIPVLLNTSFLTLRCNGPMHDEVDLGIALRNPKNDIRKNMVFSLWISRDEDIDSHSMEISLEGNKTLYHGMKAAASRDPIFRFTFDETSRGKIVYSLNGLPNDAESRISWILYRGEGVNLANDSRNRLREESRGIDRIFPEDGSHFIFWRKRQA